VFHGLEFSRRRIFSF